MGPTLGGSPRTPAAFVGTAATCLLKGVCMREGDVDETQLSLITLKFKKPIEEDAAIFRELHAMFDQVPSNANPDRLSDCKQLAPNDRVYPMMFIDFFFRPG